MVKNSGFVRFTLQTFALLLLLYLCIYAILRIGNTLVLRTSLAGGIESRYIVHNWEKDPDWYFKKAYLLSVDDPVMRNKAEHGGWYHAFYPVIAVEEYIQNVLI